MESTRRITSVLGAVVLGVLVTLAMLWALDRLVDRLDLGYRTRRNAPSTDVSIVRSEFSFRVVTNSLGFREPRLPAPKPPGTVRVVVVGDSFTQGFGVAESESYPRLLEKLLHSDDPARHYEVVNLGVPGTNPRDYEGNLREVGLDYDPDIVLVAVGANDVHDVRIQPRSGTQFGWERLPQARRDARHASPSWTRLPHILWPALYPFAREALISLAGKTNPYSSGPQSPPASTPSANPRPIVRWQDVVLALADAYDRRAQVAQRLAAIDATRVERMRPLLIGELPLDSQQGEEAYWSVIALIEPDLMSDAVLLPPVYDDAWRRVADRLRRIGRCARHVGADTVITFVPDEHQVTSRGRAILEERGFRWNARTLADTTFVDRLQALAAGDGLGFIDLLGPFRDRSEEPLYFPRDGHWTPAGHELAARTLAHGLRGRRVKAGERS